MYYRDPQTSFPYPSEIVGRCLGLVEDVVTAMSQRVLNKEGNVVPQETLKYLTPLEHQSNVEMHTRETFDSFIRSKLGDYLNPPPNPIDLNEPNTPIPDKDSILEADNYSNYDKYINAEVIIPKDGERVKSAKIIRRATASDGSKTCNFNTNSIFDTRFYEVIFNNGATQLLAANRIALNMYDQVDSYDHKSKLIDCIERHRSTQDDIPMSQGYYIGLKGSKPKKITTKGWNFLIKWRDGSQSWMPLADMKEEKPPEVAEYATTNKLVKELAFSWWVSHTLKKRHHIISAVKQRVNIKSRKYGIRVPNNITEA